MKTPTEHFWTKTVRKKGCWVWNAVRNSSGYGKFKFRGNMILAHRHAFALVNGPIPQGMCVLHRCDNPACVNPAHLWLGTHADNMRDKESKGRANHPRGDRSGSRTRPDKRPRGEQNGRAKLTERQIREIRRMYATGDFTQKELGKRFGVDQTGVSRIVSGKTWKQKGQK